ncbi:hypothetical protein [Streptomyces lydicus]|uniref:hypothetical protein n=1 Tax=Streptomyces lydicus TaxID=47763 RepID=UPI003716C06B
MSRMGEEEPHALSPVCRLAHMDSLKVLRPEAGNASWPSPDRSQPVSRRLFAAGQNSPPPARGCRSGKWLREHADPPWLPADFTLFPLSDIRPASLAPVGLHAILHLPLELNNHLANAW